MNIQLDTSEDHNVEVCGNPVTCEYCNQLFRSSPRILLERWVKSVLKESDAFTLYSLEVKLPYRDGDSYNRGLTVIENQVGRFFNHLPYIYAPELDQFMSVIQFDYELSEDKQHTDLTVSLYMVGHFPVDILTWAGHVCGELSDSWVQFEFRELGKFRDEHDLFAMVFPLFPSRETLEIMFRDGECPFGLNLEDRILLLHNCLPIDLRELSGPNPSITHFAELKEEVLKPLIIDAYALYNGLQTPPLCGLFSGEWRSIVRKLSFWGPFDEERA